MIQQRQMFLTIHYLPGDRVDTPFWQATKRLPVRDELRQRLDIWRARLPSARNIYQSFHGFES